MARRIIFKEDGLSSFGETSNGFRFLGYDGTTISEKFGVTISAIGGTGGAAQDLIITTTRSNIVISASNSTLQPGVLYHITDAHTALYGGTEIILQAISTSELDDRGMGKFYNPNYTSATGSNVWNDTYYFTTSSFTGTFSVNETITANNGAVGSVRGLVNSGSFTYFKRTSGTWSGATSITGNTSAATASISSIVSPSYTIGQKVIWGGKVWTNLTGSVGSDSGEFSLDGTNWSEVAYNETDYTVVWDEITYDITNDFITSRKDSNGNYVEQSYENYDLESGAFSILGFQWGNGTKIYNNYCRNSYFEIINFKGRNVYGNTITESSQIYDNEFGYNSILTYCVFSGYSWLYGNFIFTIASSTGWFYITVKNTSYITNNRFTNNASYLEASDFNGAVFSGCCLNDFRTYYCNFESGGGFRDLCMSGGGNDSRYNNINTQIRFTESNFPYNKIVYKNKSISGVHTFVALPELFGIAYVTSSSSPIWEDPSFSPSKQLMRKAGGTWVISSITSGGTFSVTNL